MPSIQNDRPQAENYDALSPETVLDAVETLGLRVDARILALNSYENRVYQVGIEDQDPVVVKFYRPLRWSDAAITEEHRYCDTLAEHEIPVIAPLKNENNESLHYYQGYRFAVYPRKGGYAPEVGDLDQLSWLGRLMGRIHAVGANVDVQSRPSLNISTYCQQPASFLLSAQLIPPELASEYQSITTDIAATGQAIFAAIPNGLRLNFSV